MAIMTQQLNDAVSLSTVVTIIKRHRNEQGFCRCCSQPWPCDVRIMSRLLLKEVV